jgi:hypothetical protein
VFRTAAAAALALVTILGIAVTPASAAEAAAAGSGVAAAATSASAELASDTDWTMPVVRMGGDFQVSRGAILPALYVSLAALNVYDAVSTKQGLAHGAMEGNPAMSGIVGNSTSLWAAKAVTTASTILLSEHLWKTHHKVGAIAVMVISNGLMSAVAAHNASVLNSIR